MFWCKTPFLLKKFNPLKKVKLNFIVSDNIFFENSKKSKGKVTFSQRAPRFSASCPLYHFPIWNTCSFAFGHMVHRCVFMWSILHIRYLKGMQNYFFNSFRFFARYIISSYYIFLLWNRFCILITKKFVDFKFPKIQFFIYFCWCFLQYLLWNRFCILITKKFVDFKFPKIQFFLSTIHTHKFL